MSRWKNLVLVLVYKISIYFHAILDQGTSVQLTNHTVIG